MPTRALSIQQPWADAVLTGGIVAAGKRIENRTWYTAFRGEFYIHAGKRFDKEGMEFVMDRYHEIGLALARPLLSAAPSRRGVLIGVANLVDCVRPEEVPSGQEAWAFGPWCFVLDGIRPLDKPIPCSGKLGFFSIEPTTAKERKDNERRRLHN